MLNKVQLIGHLGDAPKIASTKSGTKVAQFSLATSERWTDKQSGEKKERTEWHRCVVFNDRLVAIAEKYLKKGARIYVEGQLQTRKWTDQAGVERYTTEVTLAAFRGEITLLDRAEKHTPDPNSYGTTKSAAPAASPPADFDDDIPF